MWQISMKAMEVCIKDVNMKSWGLSLDSGWYKVSVMIRLQTCFFWLHDSETFVQHFNEYKNVQK